MEVVLVRFVGAGLALALSGTISRLPRRCVADGDELIRALAAENCPALNLIVSAAARDICSTWRRSGVPDQVAIQHLQALPALVAMYGPSAERASEIFASASGQSIHQRRAHNLAADVAGAIVSTASSEGTLHRAGLLVKVSLSLLHALIETLLTHDEDIKALVAPTVRVADYLNSQGDGDFAPGSGLRGTLERLGSECCPTPLLRALVVSAKDTGLTDAEIEQRIEGQALACQELLADTLQLANSAPDEKSQNWFSTALAQLKAGKLDDVQDFLATADDSHDFGSRSDDAMQDATQHSPQFQLSLLRARIDEVRCDWQPAAVNYRAASRRCPPFDVKGRWRLLMKQAAALTRHGLQSDDTKVLFEAAQVHVQAGGLVQEQDAPLDWAAAHVELGNLLLSIAERENRPERYLAAAIHFKPAVDVFSRAGATEDWALAQLGLARALRGQGEHQGDPVILGDAAFSYRAALGMLHAGRSPEEWRLAKYGFGTVLVRIAEETGQAGLMDEAIAALKVVLMASGENRHEIDVALGRAYAIHAAEHDDVAALKYAAEHLQSAVQSRGKSRTPTDSAVLLHLLGSTLWSLGESTRDRTQLETALQTLNSAHAARVTAGQTSQAEELSKEIANLQAALGRVRRSQRLTANVAASG